MNQEEFLCRSFKVLDESLMERRDENEKSLGLSETKLLRRCISELERTAS